MVLVDKLDEETLTQTACKQSEKSAKIKMDGFASYGARFKKIFPNHTAQVLPPSEAHIVLPWVHNYTANLKIGFSVFTIN